MIKSLWRVCHNHIFRRSESGVQPLTLFSYVYFRTFQAKRKANKKILVKGMFYQISRRSDGLADVYLTPGEAVPAYDDLSGRYDYNIRVLAVVGVDPEDPIWRGDLEGHIREHYSWWIASAKEVEM